MPLSSDQLASLERIGALLKEGAISDEEFVALKTRIMEGEPRADASHEISTPVRPQAVSKRRPTPLHVRVANTSLVNGTLSINRPRQWVRSAIESAISSLNLESDQSRGDVIVVSRSAGVWGLNACRAEMTLQMEGFRTVIRLRTLKGRLHSRGKLMQDLGSAIENALKEAEPRFFSISDDKKASAATGSNEDDDLLKAAVEAIILNQVSSSTWLSSKLRIGLDHADKLLELLEELGIVGPVHDGYKRSILVSLEEYEKYGFLNWAR